MSTLPLVHDEVGESGSSAGEQPGFDHVDKPIDDFAQGAFLTGLHAGCYVAAGVCALGLVIALALPGAPPSASVMPAAPAVE